MDRRLKHIVRMILPAVFSLRRLGWAGLAAALIFLASVSGRADIIWSDLGATLAHETGPGTDILGGAVKRDDTATDTLYFKFHVNPILDAGTEPYFAAFELYEGDAERLGVGNALRAWAYGVFNVLEAGKTNFNVFETDKTNNAAADYGIDLHSSKPSFAGGGVYYELPRKGIERTIVFKVKYEAGDKDSVTVWLDPDLGPGATEASQMESLTTKFTANSSFNQIRLRHGGGGDGWTFSEMAIATSFSDFVLDESGIKSGNAGLTIGRGQLPFTFRVWQREQGLPQNFVRALAQTRDGYLWVGSDAGVSRFDGARFVSFGLPEGFQAGPVQTLLGDGQGALWIGSVGRGLGRWQNGRFTAFTTRDGLPSDSVNALAEDGEGRLWVGTEAGLAVWQNGHLDAVSVPVSWPENRSLRCSATARARCGSGRRVRACSACGAGNFCRCMTRSSMICCRTCIACWLIMKGASGSERATPRCCIVRENSGGATGFPVTCRGTTSAPWRRTPTARFGRAP